MTTGLTNEWVNCVLGSFAFGRRQLGIPTNVIRKTTSSNHSVQRMLMQSLCQWAVRNIFKRLTFYGINHSNLLVQKNMTIRWVRLASTAKLLLEIWNHLLGEMWFSGFSSRGQTFQPSWLKNRFHVVDSTCQSMGRMTTRSFAFEMDSLVLRVEKCLRLRYRFC